MILESLRACGRLVCGVADAVEDAGWDRTSWALRTVFGGPVVILVLFVLIAQAIIDQVLFEGGVRRR